MVPIKANWKQELVRLRRRFHGEVVARPMCAALALEVGLELSALLFSALIKDPQSREQEPWGSQGISTRHGGAGHHQGIQKG